jgi:hypothetical protein
MTTPKQTVSFWDDSATREAIRKDAADHGVTMGDWLRAAVRACLPDDQRAARPTRRSSRMSVYDGPIGVMVA